MKVKLTSGELLDAAIYESPAGELLIVVGRTIKLSPDECEGLLLLAADPGELEALACAGYGRALAGLEELLKASGARLWSVLNAASGQELGCYRAGTRSAAILACLADGQGNGVDLFAELLDGE